MRRHHLIEESKTELDVAYEEVKRAETKIMSLEQEYNARISGVKAEDASNDNQISEMMEEKESLQEDLALEELYKMQSGAIERFALVSSAFTIVSSIEEEAVSVDLMRNILFRTEEARGNKVAIDRALREFASGLRAYTRKDASPENDAKVRDAWGAIEEMLRGFGRQF